MVTPKSRVLQYDSVLIQRGELLNVAAVCPKTRALGPGWRAAVWVQGCPFHCAGCISPEWTTFKPAHSINPAELAGKLLADPEISGLTFSGGEPMQQAAGLANLARKARQQRPINIITYTGYKLEVLKKGIPDRSVFKLLDETDVLIDGQFISALNDNRGMRGSSNQRVHNLTGKLKGFDFENAPRLSEVQVLDGQVLMVGVPEETLLQAFYRAMWQLESLPLQLVKK